MFKIFLTDASSFDPKSLTSFLLGIVVGFILFFIVVILLAVRGKKKGTKIYGPSVKDFKEEEIRKMILNKQDAFIYEVEENDADYLKTTLSLALELLHEIASYYYPDSKYPEYELTITEASDLIHYIVNQIVKVFENPILKNFKNMRISFIASTIDKTKKIADNKAVRAVKESGASEAITATKAFLNTLNPVYWFNKIFLKGALNITIKKVCKAALSIVGEESNRVYSKNLFDSTQTEEGTKKDVQEIFNDEVK